MDKEEIIELDIRGQICPSCLLLTLKEVNQHASMLRNGSRELVVVTDDRQATNTIPGAVDKMGYRVEVTNSDGTYKIRIGAMARTGAP